MAVIYTTSNKKVVLPHERALVIWQVMNGEIEPTPEQDKFCSTISKIYLNRHKAPQSYLDKHRDILRQMP